jgi:hypothetical protein
MSNEQHRGYHDLAGLEAGPVDHTEHNPAHWEKQVDAMLTLLSDEKRGLMRVDELRRGIETLGPDVYEKLGYYERWIESIRMILVERGVVSEDEIAARIAALQQAAP